MRCRDFQIQALAVTLQLAALVGCVDVRLRMSLRGDGSGSAQWRVEIWEATAAAGMTAAALKQKMLEDRSFHRPGVRFTTERTSSGREVLTVTLPFASVAELNDQSVEARFDRESERCRFNLRIRENNPLFPVPAEIEMPGRIVRSNADEVSGRIARFRNALRPHGVFVESEVEMVPSVYVFGLAAVVISVATAFALWRRSAKGTSLAGHPLSVEREKEAAVSGERTTATVYCGYCGTANREAFRFCKRCGAAL